MAAFGAAPTDPRYTRLAEGMRKYLAGADSPARWRWHPLDGKWYSYPQSGFILEDAGIAPTPSPAEQVFEERLGGGWEWVYRVDPPSQFGEDTAFVDLFARLEAAFDGFRARHPHAVWNARSGEWRVALNRTPQGPDVGGGTLPQEAKTRIERVREAERAGYLTRDQAARLIADIVAEYT